VAAQAQERAPAPEQVRLREAARRVPVRELARLPARLTALAPVPAQVPLLLRVVGSHCFHSPPVLSCNRKR
jgi:hypothetical protein